jgi:hypothetical protein
MAAVLPQIAPPREVSVAACFNPEFDLLLACCDGRRPAPANADWERVAQLAQDHGVLARVYEALSGNTQESELAPLRRRYDANLRKALLLTRELLRICDRLAAEGVKVLPYKGPALACQLYGNVAARQFSDIDLLVRRADVQRAQVVLGHIGYTRPLRLTPRQEAAYLQSGYEFTFDGALGRNLVELKWAVVPRFYAIDFNVGELFERAIEIEIGGQCLKTLSHEDALLVHCVHAAKHQWSELSWLCDLAQMVRLCRFDFNSVQERAIRLGINRIVETTFLLAHELLGVPLPDMIGKDKDSPALRLPQFLSKAINTRSEPDPESFAYFRAVMQSRERWQDRARLLIRLALTPGPGEWEAVRIPDWMFALYPAVRIGRLARRLLCNPTSGAKKLDSPEPPAAVLHPPG